jgi:hypothetical protein
MIGNSRSNAPGVRAAICGGLFALFGGDALAAAPASAPTPQQRALAESLFREGRKLMKDARYAEACPKLEESYRLDAAGGTLLNLALCHEAEGKTATAWTELGEALYLARKANRKDRQDLAKKHLDALEPRLSRLVVSLAEGAAGAELVVTLDGVAIGEGAWGTPLPVDPGEHVVAARAPGRDPWETRVSVGAEGAIARVTVPVLVKTAPQAPPPSAAAQRSEGARSAAWIAGGVGVAALGVGTIFGVRALSLAGDSDEGCTADGLCSAEGYAAYEDGRSAATASTIALGIGAACLAASAALFVVARSDGGARGEAGLRVAPSIGPTGAGIAAEGSF